MVAALFVQPDGRYNIDGVDVWGEARDAMPVWWASVILQRKVDRLL